VFFLCPDILAQAVVEVREEELDRDAKDDSEAEGINQGGQALTALIV
jgi:hypothetical protein